MKFLVLPFLLLSFHAAAAKVCVSGDHKLVLKYDAAKNVQLTYSFKDTFTAKLKGALTNYQRDGGYNVYTYTLTDENQNMAVIEESSFRSGGRAKSAAAGGVEYFTKFTYLGEESVYEGCYSTID